MKTQMQKTQQGFTLIELMIVVADHWNSGCGSNSRLLQTYTNKSAVKACLTEATDFASSVFSCYFLPSTDLNNLLLNQKPKLCTNNKTITFTFISRCF